MKNFLSAVFENSRSIFYKTSVFMFYGRLSPGNPALLFLQPQVHHFLNSYIQGL